MLNKSQRISKNDLQQATSPFSYHKTAYFSFKLRKNETGNIRFAFVVSKKIDKRAVVRNSLKRRMSTAVQALSLPSVGYDMVIYLKKEIETLSPGEIAAVMKQTMQKYLV